MPSNLFNRPLRLKDNCYKTYFIILITTISVLKRQANLYPKWNQANPSPHNRLQGFWAMWKLWLNAMVKKNHISIILTDIVIAIWFTISGWERKCARPNFNFHWNNYSNHDVTFVGVCTKQTATASAALQYLI